MRRLQNNITTKFGIIILITNKIQYDVTDIFSIWSTWGYSSVVEHSTADREVPGSNPGAPW